MVEAKSEYRIPGDGLQQAKEYAQMLDLKFAYSTNGPGIVEHDYMTGLDNELDALPIADELWRRDCAARGVDPDDPQLPRSVLPRGRAARPATTRTSPSTAPTEAILKGKRRVLLTIATGTGKTVVAFQICWRLWSTGWNRTGEYRKPRILYLADRNVLVDDPKDKTFAPFGDARHKIEGGDAARAGRCTSPPTRPSPMTSGGRACTGSSRATSSTSSSSTSATAAAPGTRATGGRSSSTSSRPYQLGMTATPLRDDNRDTYRYFGNPIYTYSLRQGIEDGFLAPYRVHRVVTDCDAAGWRPSQGRPRPLRPRDPRPGIRDQGLRARRSRSRRGPRPSPGTSPTSWRRTDPFAKTIVFCVDQEHADEMRRALNNLNADRVRQYPDYVCRVTADEGDIGGGHLSRFQELETVLAGDPHHLAAADHRSRRADVQERRARPGRSAR